MRRENSPTRPLLGFAGHFVVFFGRPEFSLFHLKTSAQRGAHEVSGAEKEVKPTFSAACGTRTGRVPAGRGHVPKLRYDTHRP